MSAPAEHLGEGSGRRKQGHSTSTDFSGTDNPRHLRALHGLLTRPQTREHIDRIAGCSNGPELIAELRRRGLDIPCERVPVIDRDGKEVKRGVYHLVTADRRKIHAWLRRRQSGFMNLRALLLLAVSLPALAVMLADVARRL